MSLIRCNAFVLAAAMVLGLHGTTLFAAGKAKAPSAQPVSMLGGQLQFQLPREYIKSPMPEIDAKARAAGITGTLYMNKAARRVVIVTESPLEKAQPVSSNDSATLDGIVAATAQQQKASYKDFKQLGEKKMVRRGLGVRQLDISGSVDGGKVLSSTVAAASGKRMAMVNVISLEKDAKAHGELLKAITDNKKR